MFERIRKKMFKRSMDFFDISLEELKLKQNQGAIIIDVRSSQEYLEGHLAGAINIPYYEINRNVYNIINRNKEIVVYCQEGVRSKQAFKILKKLKYERVFNLYGGLENWS